jgi:acyl carrier protein
MPVKTIDDFVALLRDELGLPVAAGDMDQDLHQVAGWDSVHLLSLLGILERRTGHSLSLADALEAPSLEAIFSLAVQA